MLVDGLDCMVGDIPIASLFAVSSRTPSFASSVVVAVDLLYRGILCFSVLLEPPYVCAAG